MDNVTSHTHTFTVLMKKYSSSKASTIKKSTPEENSENITKNSSAACLSTSELNPQLSSPATSSVPEPTIKSELVKLVASNLPENTVHSKKILIQYLKPNTLVESDVSTDQSNITCIFCDQKTKKHRSERLPLHSCDKKDFIFTIDQENENHRELINKIVNYSLSKTFYHRLCRLDFFYKASEKEETNQSDWHDLHQHHQTAFEEVSVFINENMIKKGRCYFLI
ncbi:uncharacterized protein TNCT_608421 [Trichonephila clavata]|uniref:Uncharacterized protein n=1 Tax=Trichonephila clavata TaxID=2740835 RepID=A0A8X6KM16_TRICU|nr:uncharacterized protein TNCT_608421 [Trichonephila clavata]